MERHATMYEICEAAQGRYEKLFDADYIQEHLKVCKYCIERKNVLVSDSIVLDVPPLETVILPDNGSIFGYLFHSGFDEKIHTHIPDEQLLLLASSNVYKDAITGIDIVRVMVLHDYPGLAGSGELVLTGEDNLDGWVVSLWSEMEVPLSSLDNKIPVGTISNTTLSIIDNYLKKGECDDNERIYQCPVVHNSDARTQFRRRLLFDMQPLTEDLRLRRDWKLYVLDEIEELLPKVSDRDDPSVFIGLDELLANLPMVKTGLLLNQDFSDIPYQNMIEGNARLHTGSPGILKLIILESQRYILSGVTNHKHLAKSMIPEVKEFARHEKNQEKDLKVDAILDTMSFKAHEYINKKLLEINRLKSPVELEIQAGYLGDDKKVKRDENDDSKGIDGAKKETASLGLCRIVDGCTVQFKVIFIDSKMAKLSIMIEDQAGKVLPAMRVNIFKEDELQASKEMKQLTGPSGVRSSVDFTIRRDNYIIRLTEDETVRVVVAINML